MLSSGGLSEDLTERLFSVAHTVALDLAALNIQVGTAGHGKTKNISIENVKNNSSGGETTGWPATLPGWSGAASPRCRSPGLTSHTSYQTGTCWRD